MTEKIWGSYWTSKGATSLGRKLYVYVEFETSAIICLAWAGDRTLMGILLTLHDSALLARLDRFRHEKRMQVSRIETFRM